MLLYHMGWSVKGPAKKGKRIRPLLVCLVTHMAGGKWQDAIPAAISIELIHNFSLIHDDIQDQSPTRHGQDTLWLRNGISQAINAGDAMFALALDEIWKLTAEYPIAIVSECSRTLTSTCLSLTEGQYLDIDFEKRKRVSPAEYQTMIEGKTASLITACAQIGALLGTGDPSRIDDFKAYGYNLGLAFQVIDDYLGIWGDAVITGKSTDSDLVSGKMSYPVVLALSQSDAFADRWKVGNITPEEIPALINMLDNARIGDQTRAKADEYTTNALNYLHAAASSHPDFDILNDLTGWLLKREV
jgi:geranylgeranyl diphosphate synthase type I